MPAQLRPNPPPAWAALRTWAAALRDQKPPHPRRREAVTLCMILDSYLDLLPRHPAPAAGLWESALLLAERLAGRPPTQAAP